MVVSLLETRGPQSVQSQPRQPTGRTRPVPKTQPSIKASRGSGLAGLAPRMVGRVSAFWNGEGDVEHAYEDAPRDAGRVGELAPHRIRSQEAAHADAIDAAGWIAGRHTNDDGFLSCVRQVIPDGRCLDGAGGGEAEAAVE